MAASGSQTLAQKVDRRLSYIGMMEGCGFYKGAQKHTLMVQDTVEGVLTFLKQQKDVSADMSIDIHEVFKKKLEQDHVDYIMGHVPPRYSACFKEVYATMRREGKFPAVGENTPAAAAAQLTAHWERVNEHYSARLFQYD